MADITWDDVINIAPELDGAFTPETEAAILLFANGFFNPDAFKATSFTMARALLAAHFATMGPNSGGAAAAGPVLEERAGELERRYADMVSGAAGAAFSGTTYGDMLMFVMRTSKGRRPFVVRSRRC